MINFTLSCAACSSKVRELKNESPMAAVTHIADLQKMARRRVPKMFYDYADSGAWTESTYRDNEDAFQRIKLRQRCG